MKITTHGLVALALVLVHTLALADLPTARNNTATNQQRSSQPYPYSQQYGQGQGYGATYYPQNYFNDQTVSSNNRGQQSGTKLKAVGDLLWLFTGSDASPRDQMKKGFRSESDTTFGRRLYSVFLGAAYRKFGIPIENKIGALADGILGGSQTQNPYGQTNAGGYCYECLQQQANNPYARNSQAIDSAIFNGTSTSGIGGGSQAGQIKR